MSVVLSSPFNKPECGDLHQHAGIITQAHLRDVLGGHIDLQVVGTDPAYVGPVTLVATDYEPAVGVLNPDGTFMIIPETDNAVYVVGLADGTQYTITAVQSHAYLGQVWPGRIFKVFASGTTGSFSVVY